MLGNSYFAALDAPVLQMNKHRNLKVINIHTSKKKKKN